MFKINVEKQAIIDRADLKHIKELALNTLFVEVNGVKYDAHKDAITNMNATINIANQMLSRIRVANSKLSEENQITESQMYDEVFKSVTYWKGYDNDLHEVQIESLAEALDLAVRARGAIYGV